MYHHAAESKGTESGGTEYAVEEYRHGMVLKNVAPIPDD